MMKYYSFSWDNKKNLSNQKKHNISFDEAKTVFYDENALEFFDPDHSVDEDRYLLLGLSNKLRILLVSYTLESEHIIRIISARKATKNETKQYPGG
jgi:uncharacterized protein